jgi:hypothetical protein
MCLQETHRRELAGSKKFTEPIPNDPMFDDSLLPIARQRGFAEPLSSAHSCHKKVVKCWHSMTPPK